MNCKSCNLEENKEEFKFKGLNFNVKQVQEEKNNSYYEGRIYIPISLQYSLLHFLHNLNPVTSHMGQTNTWKYLKRKYFWPSMYEDLINCISICKVCTEAKKFRGIVHQFRQIGKEFNKKFQSISIDHFGFKALPRTQQGFTGILTIRDNVTGYVKFIPVKRKTTEETFQVLFSQWFCYFGFPEQIYSDNAKEFRDGLQVLLKEKLELDHGFCGIYTKSKW